MRNNLFCLLGCIFCFSTCRMPSVPQGEIKIIKRLETINTGGNCLDLDVDMDIEDSILVAVANYNGYFVYKINSIDGIVTDISEKEHIEADEMNPNQGDNQAQTVILSKEHNIAFVLDKYEHIWLHKYEDGATQYETNYLEEDCFGSTWLSVAIDDQMDSIGVYTLLKHNAEASGDFLGSSTSLVWTNLKGVNPSSASPEQDKPNCEYIINQGSIAEKIHFSNILLTQSYGELGVRVFKKTNDDICLINSGLIDLNASNICINHTYPAGQENSGEIDYFSCCEEADICPEDLFNSETGECAPYFIFGHGGKYASSGGIMPEIYAEFDTPGEVEAVFSEGNIIFAGLKYSNGCLITELDDEGLIIGNIQFAIGYSVNSIHQDNGLLALAAGHDGILLFDWDGGLDISFIGIIETAYANNVHVAGNILFAATEDGIEIIQIDHTP